MELFPAMKTQPSLRLASLRLEEEQSQYYIDRALEVFDVNTVGPQLYVGQYVKYIDLLTNKAEREAETFLMEQRTIDEMKTVEFSFHLSFSFHFLQPPVRRMPVRKAVLFCACFSSFF